MANDLSPLRRSGLASNPTAICLFLPRGSIATHDNAAPSTVPSRKTELLGFEETLQTLTRSPPTVTRLSSRNEKSHTPEWPRARCSNLSSPLSNGRQNKPESCSTSSLLRSGCQRTEPMLRLSSWRCLLTACRLKTSSSWFNETTVPLLVAACRQSREEAIHVIGELKESSNLTHTLPSHWYNFPPADPVTTNFPAHTPILVMIS
mmetsp:Transcript_31554/g.75358  ORF Transcript_31554/g.75358 Transcript_31554/m.75358 type:complete len:205 (-) Transcript_31554:2265-2879(-)